jgi:hypothetical protein
MLPLPTLGSGADNAVFEAFEVLADAYTNLNPICGDASSPAASVWAGLVQSTMRGYLPQWLQIPTNVALRSEGWWRSHIY